MSKKIHLRSLVGCGLVTIFFVVACGVATKDKDEDKNKDNSSSTTSSKFLTTTKAELPACSADTKGTLAYVSDEKVFYTCDGTTWASIDTGSGIEGSAVTQADGKKLGTVVIGQWPMIGVKLTDGSIVSLYRDGTYASGYCNASMCQKVSAITAPTTTTYYTQINERDRSTCFYTASNCTGTCYLTDKPVKGSLFRPNASSWLKASGNETSAGSVSVLSAWRHDYGDCVSSVGASATISKAYPVTDSYATFPDGLTYPFSGPLNVGL